MADKEKITELVKGLLEGDMFPAGIEVSASNVIRVFIDSFSGLTIEDCALFHRKLEEKLDRESEDFELQVSFPGLSEGYRVREQYFKNIGRPLEILTIGGEKITGLLKSAGDDGFVIDYTEKVKVEGKKKKQTVVKEIKLDYQEIKSAKVIVTFNKLKRDGKY